MSNTGEVANISPYVAAAIIEHVKRRGMAAGFLMGPVMKEGIYVSDYVPYTHPDNSLHITNQKEYRAEVNRRVAAKQAFGDFKPVGWYTAGVFNKPFTVAEFREWCDGPATIFADRMALHLHCELPTPGCMNIRWSAFRATVITNRENAKRVHCTRGSQVDVVIGDVNHHATNVFLSHVLSVAFLKGGQLFSSSSLLNLDTIVADMSATSRQAMEHALMHVHQKLNDVITEARDVVRSATSSAEKKKESQLILTHVDALRRIKEEEIDRQHNSSSREDMNTQKFKDALMIKCLAMLLRQQVGQIENLARQYNDSSNRHGARD